MFIMCFLSGSIEFWCMLDRGCLYDQPPVKTLGAESLQSFISHVLSQLVAQRIVSRGHWNLVPRFFWTSPHVPFPSADCALCPFIIISHSCEYSCMLCPVILSSDSSNLGLVLEMPDTFRAGTKLCTFQGAKCKCCSQCSS